MGWQMKRIFVIGCLVGAAVVMLLAAIPFLLSSETVKTRLTGHITELTGWQVRFDGDPTVTFRPYLGIQVRNVRVRRDQLDETPPFIHIDELHANLKLLPALLGTVDVASYRLVRPQIRLEVDANGVTSWRTGRGRIHHLIDKLAGQVKTTAGIAEGLEIPSLAVGAMVITSGDIQIIDHREGVEEAFTNVNAMFSWPRLDTEAQFTGNGVWRGQLLGFDFQLDAPVQLMAGGLSPAAFSIDTPLASVRFEGKANAFSDLHLEGHSSLETPSLRRLASFMEGTLASGSLPGPFAVTGALAGNRNRVHFTEASVKLDGNSASGVLQLERNVERKPKLSGTLAFGELDLSAYLEQISRDTGATEDAADLSFLGKFDLDLRVSASKAEFSRVALTDLAAAATVRDGKLVLDIGDASIFDGRATAILQANHGAAAPELMIQATTTGLALEQVSDILPAGAMRLSGTGDIDLDLSGTGTTAEQLLHDLEGTVLIRATDGQVEGLALDQILHDGDDITVVGINNATDGNTQFSTLSMAAKVGSGVTLIEEAFLKNRELEAVAWGRADLSAGGLAVQGAVRGVSQTGDPLPKLRDDPSAELFFVGGTMKWPLFTRGRRRPFLPHAPDVLEPVEPAQNKKSGAIGSDSGFAFLWYR